jgi:hypothetical protein
VERRTADPAGAPAYHDSSLSGAWKVRVVNTVVVGDAISLRGVSSGANQSRQRTKLIGLPYILTSMLMRLAAPE